jgi:hypothetical protein
VTHEPIVPDAPVLKIRASGASDQDIDEISLGGVSLIGSVISIDLRAGARELTTATLVVEVIPDIETPAVIAPAEDRRRRIRACRPGGRPYALAAKLRRPDG